MTWSLDELRSLSSEQALLDVRTPDECAQGVIPGAMQVPLDQIPARLAEFRPGVEYLVYCRIGQRGEKACYFLNNHGIRCRNLPGGYLAYEAAQNL
jgi:rhodanese-related sulfurtransferase